jgi:mutator protein MutT
MKNPRAAGWTESRALLERPGRELLILKLRTDDPDCTWEFPGGRLENRESPEAALRRILRAALGIEVELLQGQPPFVHNFGTHSITYRYYMCGIARGNMRQPPGSETRWVKIGQLREYDFDAPTQQVVSWLLEPEG